jgi:hypothetical protein
MQTNSDFDTFFDNFFFLFAFLSQTSYQKVILKENIVNNKNIAIP